ncbi:Protein CBG15976 [Caenorhabditis briggsae]|uniref:Protein CBG15976 n=1 Tax=Caenorhabditis briggsae TaxID=6238 RepID=A8XND3_CAEBR|nr:Protein CBG15976 [Caenorhabditis briggsae]CAP34364.2 Protein CBG15976 [Caenorhabditis briggsae]
MQTLRNPLSIFRARSRSRERSTSHRAVTQSEKSDKYRSVVCYRYVTCCATTSSIHHIFSRNRNETTEKKSITVSSTNGTEKTKSSKANSPEKAPTQKLFVKRDKNATECLAETKIERKSICREKTHKSIVLPQPRFYTCERIQKTVKEPEPNSGMSSKKSTHWCYVAAPKHITLQPGPSGERSSGGAGGGDSVETKSGSSKNGFSTEAMIEEIFAPLRETIQEGIKETRHLSSSPEKIKLNHTPSTRLELWKAQLNSSASTPRIRDASAPATVQRLTIKPQTTQLNIPRPVHTTQSASNALATMDHRTLKDVSARRRSGTWQPFSSNTYNADRPPIDFVTSPRYSHEATLFRPIPHRPKPDFINHNDNNRRSFRRVDSMILRSDSKDSNGSLSDLLMIYQAKETNREMNASIRSTASNSSSFPYFSPEQINQQKTVLTTLSSSSSGIHVTPSPSDSGIIDYENLIRDKELELQEIRNTMEQNEEIIIKVYQDKERAWKTELEGLKCRVSAAEKGEKALREQLSNCQRQNSAMSSCMRTVQEEKTRLMAKCIQLEREIDNFQNVSVQSANCPNCSNPVKEKDLRQEVQDLRREVVNLKQVVDDGRHFKTQ